MIDVYRLASSLKKNMAVILKFNKRLHSFSLLQQNMYELEKNKDHIIERYFLFMFNSNFYVQKF